MMNERNLVVPPGCRLCVWVAMHEVYIVCEHKVILQAVKVRGGSHSLSPVGAKYQIFRLDKNIGI